jgi:hypothetical protein
MGIPDVHLKNSYYHMKGTNEFFATLYIDFNDRRIDRVVRYMTPDVKWANGMDGGFVYGKGGVMEYWRRQFAQVSSKVMPMEIREADGKICVKVHQVVNDLDGTLLADEMVTHVFTLTRNKISQFEIKK